MKILNLYAGLGGNRKKWEGNEITAVENDTKISVVYRNLYPKDKVWIADAHSFLESNYKDYDFIWSSPPCQSHSKMMKATRHNVVKYFDLALYQEIILLQHFYKGLWVVENVVSYYEPLIKPTAIIGRHCFWSNFKILPFKDIKFPNFINADTVVETEELKKWLGINYEGNIYYKGNHSPGQVLRNCVHPDLGLHILNCALNKEVVTQSKMFDL